MRSRHISQSRLSEYIRSQLSLNLEKWGENKEHGRYTCLWWAQVNQENTFMRPPWSAGVQNKSLLFQSNSESVQVLRFRNLTCLCNVWSLDWIQLIRVRSQSSGIWLLCRREYYKISEITGLSEIKKRIRISHYHRQSDLTYIRRGEWGKLSHPPQFNPKKAEEKMLMSSICWSYSKELLHHAALNIHLVV